jgi:hypothetical protein
MTGHRYTPEEIQFIKDNIAGRTHAELLELFNRRFKTCITKKAMHGFLHRHKLKNDRYNPPCQIGSEYVHKGYVLTKIAEPNVWKEKHILIWEAANGPVTKGHVVIFADGNRRNFAPDNLLMVSHRELAAMNKKHLIFPDADMTKAGLLIAKIIIRTNDFTGTVRKYRKNRRGEQ